MSKLLSAPKYCYVCIPKHSQLKLILQNHNLGFYKLDISRSFYSIRVYIFPGICSPKLKPMVAKVRKWGWTIQADLEIYWLPNFPCISYRLPTKNVQQFHKQHFSVSRYGYFQLQKVFSQRWCKSVINFGRSACSFAVGWGIAQFCYNIDVIYHKYCWIVLIEYCCDLLWNIVGWCC